ncbi:unnamed protein product [Closterium sp. NIES-64]|nr:unnamed protein product [Closterium sp. NIES-65]CAI5998026.1 unnamed protein product [Closterium sp. NIES-64]
MPSSPATTVPAPRTPSITPRTHPRVSGNACRQRRHADVSEASHQGAGLGGDENGGVRKKAKWSRWSGFTREETFEVRRAAANGLVDVMASGMAAVRHLEEFVAVSAIHVTGVVSVEELEQRLKGEVERIVEKQRRSSQKLAKDLEGAYAECAAILKETLEKVEKG